MKRKRSKVGRYDPKLVKELRVEMAKCPNPVYGQMVAEGNMNDADMMDFALSLSCSYFSGVLLRIFEDTAKANMTLQMRRAVLVTAALFGATADFDNDGMRIMLLGDDSDLITFAVQQLVDTGNECRGSNAAPGATASGTVPNGIRHRHPVTRDCGSCPLERLVIHNPACSRVHPSSCGSSSRGRARFFRYKEPTQ